MANSFSVVIAWLSAPLFTSCMRLPGERNISRQSRTRCDEQLKQLLQWKPVGWHMRPTFVSFTRLNDVMTCYTEAASLNPGAASFLEPGPPEQFNFEPRGKLADETFGECCSSHMPYSMAGPLDLSEQTTFPSISSTRNDTFGCFDADDDDDLVLSAKMTMRRLCWEVVKARFSTMHWQSYADWLQGLQAAINRLPESTLPMVHIMRLASGGSANMNDADKFLWKSNMWVLANAWASLSLRDDFRMGGVLFVDTSDKNDASYFKRSQETSGLPFQIRPLLLGDVSYSGTELRNTIRFVMSTMTSAGLFDIPKRCDYVMGTIFEGGYNYKPEYPEYQQCHVEPGHLMKTHDEEVQSRIQKLTPAQIALPLTFHEGMLATELDNHSAPWSGKLQGSQVDLLPDMLAHLQTWWTHWAKEKWVRVFPTFVTQFKIPDTLSLISGGNPFVQLLDDPERKVPKAGREPYKNYS